MWIEDAAFGYLQCSVKTAGQVMKHEALAAASHHGWMRPVRGGPATQEARQDRDFKSKSAVGGVQFSSCSASRWAPTPTRDAEVMPIAAGTYRDPDCQVGNPPALDEIAPPRAGSTLDWMIRVKGLCALRVLFIRVLCLVPLPTWHFV